MPGALKCPSTEERPPAVFVVEDLESPNERRTQSFYASVYVQQRAFLSNSGHSVEPMQDLVGGCVKEPVLVLP